MDGRGRGFCQAEWLVKAGVVRATGGRPCIQHKVIRYQPQRITTTAGATLCGWQDEQMGTYAVGTNIQARTEREREQQRQQQQQKAEQSGKHAVAAGDERVCLSRGSTYSLFFSIANGEAQSLGRRLRSSFASLLLPCCPCDPELRERLICLNGAGGQTHV